MKKVAKGHVSVTNNNLCKIDSIGTVTMIVDDQSFEIENVWYVPDLGYNFISKGLLEYQEFKVSLMHEDWRSYYSIEAPNSVIFEAHQGEDFIY